MENATNNVRRTLTKEERKRIFEEVFPGKAGKEVKDNKEKKE